MPLEIDMADTLNVAAEMAKSGRMLGAVSLLMHPTRLDGESRFIAADLMLSRLPVEGFEDWARFQEPLLRQFEKALNSSVIDPGRLLNRWMESVREKGLGLLPPFLVGRLRGGLDNCLDAELRTLAKAALALLDGGEQPLSRPLEEFHLPNRDSFLLMKRFHESGRATAARQLVELRLRQSKGKSMWDHHWHSQVLLALGQYDAAFDAQYQFVKHAVTGSDPKPLRNGVPKALNLIPFCGEMKRRLSQLRELTASRNEFDDEFGRYQRLIDDIEAFRGQAGASAAVSIGRRFYQSGQLPRIEEDLQREMRLKPSASACYELAKVAALRGDSKLARERLKTVSGLDTLFFDRKVIRE